MKNKDFAKALELQDKLLPLHRAAFLEPNPCPTKYALEILGKCKSDVRPPLSEIEENTKTSMLTALKHAELIS